MGLTWNDPEEEEEEGEDVNHFAVFVNKATADQWGVEMVLGDLTWKRLIPVMPANLVIAPYMTFSTLSYEAMVQVLASHGIQYVSLAWA